ncbi:MAG TPA: hypothetical protein VNA69_14915 [Thermoanaerobaculia bacterium]|nr:hypothetical protein [Thermoanaerobaculia bacterium]
MKKALTLLFTLLVATTAIADIEGSWTASTDDEKPGKFHMNMSRGRQHNFGNAMSIAGFTGLSDAQIRGASSTPVQFQLAREAGTVSFEGSFRNGNGAGQFTFTPNRNYPAAIRALGIEFDLGGKREGKSEEDHLFTLAVLDVSTSYIKSLQAEGYRETLEKYLSMRIFNVTPEYIREMRGLGFREIDADDLVSTRIHKVTPEFAEEMRKLGYNLSFNDLISFRIHRVTPELIRELRTLGYDKVDADDLVAMRIHRVTPEFIRELKDAGYNNVPVEKLVSMRIHKIDVKYIRKMNDVD